MALYCLCLCLCLVRLTHSTIDFAFNRFNDSILDLKGAIVTHSGALQLTNKSRLLGSAFYRNRIPISTDYNSSFTTYFVFQIVPSPTRKGGYGLAFTLSPSPGFPGAEGSHYLGVFNSFNDRSASNHIFMVEFDTMRGYNEREDSKGNHIAININGMNSSVSKAPEYLRRAGNTDGFDLEDDGPIQAWIDYDGRNKVVNVTAAPFDVRDKPTTPLLTWNINLPDFFKENVYAGFSASTLEQGSAHYILGWKFRINGAVDPFNRSELPKVPDEEPPSSNSILTKALIATFSAVLFILLVALGATLFCRRMTNFEVLEKWELDCPHRFRYRDLYKATKGFKESEIIGVGGFGSVYRGVLPSTGAEIAVKKIMSNNPLQGMREFAAEIESLGRLRHKNLVNLQGWCKNKNNLLLVYEYVPNGSLDSWLYNSSKLLTWEQRFNIIKGVASGLSYLHEDWEQVVVHRDVKSSNILIDNELNARLGDFGLARLYDHGKNSHTTNVVGTIGYIAPELTQTGRASASTDVYAYGILLLEVACGRAPVVCVADRNIVVVDWVLECMENGSSLDAADAKLNGMYVVEEMELVLGLGLICSNPRAEARPSMKQIIKYLNGDELPPLLDTLDLTGSTRSKEITSRLLALGLTDIVTSSSNPSKSMGSVSFASFDSVGR